MKRFLTALGIGILTLSSGCTGARTTPPAHDTTVRESAQSPAEVRKKISPEQIVLQKELLYDQHTLTDTYPYKDTTRSFQWEKIKELLALIENSAQDNPAWGILQNRKNINGEAPLVKEYRRNAYNRIADTLGVERYQGIPLYAPDDTLTPQRYAQDGSLVRRIDTAGSFTAVEAVYFPGVWLIPSRYVKPIGTARFDKVIFVDRDNENIAALERSGDRWLIRSMNPATTGLHNPPYMMETPLGIFVIQEKKSKMIYLVDGSVETGGFAPYASRFSNGGYIHGIPVNEPRTQMIEFSPTLGTTPRSHMCVRNATSHAKFIYEWAPAEEGLVVVLE